MGLAGKTTNPVEIPHEPGNYFTFRTLSGRQMDEAERENQRQAMLLLDGVKRIEVSEDQRAQTRAQQNPHDNFDKGVVCKYGIAAWQGPSYEGDPCLFGNIELLDAPTRDWAAKQILDLVLRTVPEELASARP